MRDDSDTLRDVLDVATEVLLDYAGDPGSTRLERMARWLVENLAGPAIALVDPPLVRYVTDPNDDGVVVLPASAARDYTAEEARTFAVMMLQAAEDAER